MASRLLNRHDLRRQAEHVDPAAPADSATAVLPLKKPRKARTPAVPKVRKPRAKKAPPRMCARWGLFDSAMKQVAIFNFNERAAADEKLAELLTKKNSYYMQIVKEVMAEATVLAPVVEQEDSLSS
jgi:hypothetical protein